MTTVAQHGETGECFQRPSGNLRSRRWSGLLQPAPLLVLGTVTIAVITIVTLDCSPTVWQDEVQVADYGRCLFEPETAWAITTLEDGKPQILRFPLYLVLQQAWLRLSGTSPFTVRCFSLACAIGAAAAFFLFLREGTNSGWLSALIALAFLCDPLFVRSYRGGRPDALAICFALLGGLLFRRAVRKRQWVAAVLSGMLAVAAAATWPTAAVLLPGIAILTVLSCGQAPYRQLVRYTAMSAAGVVIGVALYLALAWPLLPRMYAEASLLPHGKHLSVRLPGTNTLVGVLRQYQHAPWVPVMWGLALGFGFIRRWGFAVVLVVAAAVVAFGANLVPPFYTWRILYICPILYAASGFAIPDARRWRVVLAAVLGLSAAATLGLRTAVAMAEAECRSYERYESALSKMIPEDAVVLGGWDYYYIGLRRRWKMFTDAPLGTIAQRYPVSYLVRDRAGVPDGWVENFDCEFVGAYCASRERNTSWLSRYGRARCYRAWVYRCTPRKRPRGSDQGAIVPGTP